jgi:phosphate transport system permease protein
MQRKEPKQDNYREKIQDIMSKQSSKKKLVDRIMTAFAIICVAFALIPLASILIEVVKNGISAISIEFLTQPPGSFF